MGKVRYDLIFGLGFACSCSESLRAAKLQLLSFPYDWITLTVCDGLDYSHELPNRIHEITEDFQDWLSPEEFVFYRCDEENRKDVYINRRLKYIFNHDFPAGIPFSESFPMVQMKYRRRINRLLGLIRSARRILIVRVDRPDLPIATDIADCQAAVRALEDHFAPARFDFLQISFAEGQDEIQEESFAGNVTRWTLDYQDHRPDVGSWRVDVPLLGELLKKRFSVRDYRTRLERQTFDAARRQKRYAKVGARNYFEYQLRRIVQFVFRFPSLFREIRIATDRGDML